MSRPPFLTRALLIAVAIGVLLGGCSGPRNLNTATPSPEASEPRMAPTEAGSSQPPVPAAAPAQPSVEATPRSEVPSMPLRADGAPIDAVGPLVVYAEVRRTGDEPTGDRAAATEATVIVTYDAGAQRELGRFELLEETADVNVLGLRHHDLLVARRATEDGRPSGDATLVTYDLAGDERSRLEAISMRGTTPLLSRDGSLVAGVVRCDGETCIHVLDTRSGEALISRSNTVVVDGATFHLEPHAWIDDGPTLVTLGLQLSGNLQRYFTVDPIGGVKTEAATPLGVTAPNGQLYMAVGDGITPWIDDAVGGCSVYRSITVRSHTDVDDATTYSLEGEAMPGLLEVEWSPNSRQILYPTLAMPAPTDEPCTPAFREWRAGPERWRLIDLDEGRSSEVADPYAVRTGWADHPLIERRCGAERRVLVVLDESRDRSLCLADSGDELGWELLIDGETVTTFGRPQTVRVIGISRWVGPTIRSSTGRIDVHVAPFAEGRDPTPILGQLPRWTYARVIGRSNAGYFPIQWIQIEGGGWIKDVEDGIELSVRRPALPEPDWLLATTYPEETRTGIPAIDRLLDVLAAYDADELLALLETRTVECVALEEASHHSSKICPPGVSAGTELRRFMTSRNFGMPVWEPELRAFAEQLAEREHRLYAVIDYRHTEIGWSYGLVTVVDGGSAWQYQLNEDGSVASLAFGESNTPPGSWLAPGTRRGGDILTAPIVAPPLVSPDESLEP